MIKVVKMTPKESMVIRVPALYYNKLCTSINNAINTATEINDEFGFHKSTRVYKSNILSFTDKVMYIVSRIYYHLSVKQRIDGKFLCSDFSEKQLSELLGDCTRNKTKIGWQSIKSFLLKNEIIDIADKKFIHDSYLNKSQSIGYTLFGMKGLFSKPELRKSKNGKIYSSNRNFTVDELTFVNYEVTDRKFLRCIAKNHDITYDDETIVGHQLELLTKYKVDPLDYNFVTNCISGTMEQRYLFHEDKTIKGKFGECSLLKNMMGDSDVTSFKIKQSPYSSRIFSNLTSARKFARAFINFNDSENVFSEFDLKSSQLVLAAFQYNKEVHDHESLSTLSFIVTNDLYQVVADKVKLMNHKSSIYTRDDMKKMAFKSIFSKKDYEDNIFTKALSKLFPGFYKFLNKHKTNSNHSKLAIKLQRIESSIFVGDYMYNYKTGISKAEYIPEYQRNEKSICILGELYKLGIDAFSVHDSILVNISQASKICNVPKEDVWDLILVPIIAKVFKEKFSIHINSGIDLARWLMGTLDECEEYINNRRKKLGEMRLFSRYDNFNQFRTETFRNISQKYNTGLHFNDYNEYRKYVEVGDFSKYMNDIPDDESFWNNHDKNDPKYKPYFDMKKLEDECPF